jgi:hypothetical protein
MYRGTTPTLTFRLPIDGPTLWNYLNRTVCIQQLPKARIDDPTLWDYLITNSRISVLPKARIDDLPVWNDLDWGLCI